MGAGQCLQQGLFFDISVEAVVFFIITFLVFSLSCGWWIQVQDKEQMGVFFGLPVNAYRGYMRHGPCLLGLDQPTYYSITPNYTPDIINCYPGSQTQELEPGTSSVA